MRWMNLKVRHPVSGNILYDLHCIAFVSSITRINSLQ